MNDAAVIDPPETFAEKAVPLLKEYLEKILDIKKQFRALHIDSLAVNKDTRAGLNTTESKKILLAEFQALEQYFNRLRPAITQFSQQVSGMIDQGRVTPLTRSELQMRLAELESVMTQMTPLIIAYRPH